MRKLSQKLFFLLSAPFLLNVCHTQAIETKMIPTQENQTNQNKSYSLAKIKLLEQKVAERMVLDIRYFCDDSEKVASKNCRQTVTELPWQLSQMIKDSNIGGIVLFAENVIETEQVVKLTYDIQTAALKSAGGKPIIIAMDQEGGRVARFAKMTGFSGNMAIGATYEKYGVDFSTQVNAILGKELKALGINNNYAPVVDVNTNASNPVINTRSYGENAQQVAKLGVAAVDALQTQGVMATLKHFPGHGDTHVDSHIGLPKVEHDLVTIEKVDLAPFALAIEKTKPAMIMTAHIQYPVLDDSTFTAKSGEQLIRPATMSKKILTDLLRNKMNFDGIIATDALDMAGISHYFTEVEAVVETFIAGADLAVMPFKVRNSNDIKAFTVFIKQVAKSLNERFKHADSHSSTTHSESLGDNSLEDNNLTGNSLAEYSLAEFEESVARLERYKNSYIQLSNTTLAEQIKHAKAVVAKAEHLAVEQSLANAAVTVLQGNIEKSLAPFVSHKAHKKVHLVVANEQELFALRYAIKQVQNEVENQSQLRVSYSIANSNFNEVENDVLMKKADLLVVTIDVKTASLVDIGGMDDLVSEKTRGYGSEEAIQQKHSYGQRLKVTLVSAKKQRLTSVLIAKGSPYLLSDYNELVDIILLNFDDRIYSATSAHENLTKEKDKETQLISPGFNAAMAVLFSSKATYGHLPVTLK